MSSIKLTKEQLEVINFPIKTGEVLVVEAGAGTGKTTCFIEFAKRKPKERILYLCFNNKSAKQAQSMYRDAQVENTRASTIHGLASKTKSLYTRLGKFKEKITPKDLESRLKIDATKSCIILKTIKTFCESADTQIGLNHIPCLDGITIPSSYINKLDRSHAKQGPQNKEGGHDVNPMLQDIQRLSQKVWDMMVDPRSTMPVSYDHYLKIYQLSKPILPYDYLLLDEAQDSNPVALALLESQKQRVKTILIGDKNQAIYGWRGAKDAMGKYSCITALPLTQSFRFGKNIAKVANNSLRQYQGVEGRILGTDKKDSVTINNKEPLKVLKTPETQGSKHKGSSQPNSITLIARTNATLFDMALALAQKGERYHFLGTSEENNWDPSRLYKLNDLKDVYHLWSGNPQNVVNPYLKIYSCYENLKLAAFGGIGQVGQVGQDSPKNSKDYSEGKNPAKPKASGDTELAFLCRLVEKYRHAIPSVTQTLKAHCVGPNPAPGDKIVILTTAHRAKGLEWDCVKVADDFLKNTSSISKENFQEEANLLYVAITRAKSQLIMPESLRSLVLNDQELTNSKGTNKTKPLRLPLPQLPLEI